VVVNYKCPIHGDVSPAVCCEAAQRMDKDIRPPSRLLTLIADYDRDREAYIADLERQLLEERTRYTECQTLLMRATATNERKTLDLILAGHFDRKEPTP
jgi:hypothetical protein